MTRQRPEETAAEVKAKKEAKEAKEKYVVQCHVTPFRVAL
jgi:hypothetical protein